jgi:PelA/Pel-15E family pectate lyase
MKMMIRSIVAGVVVTFLCAASATPVRAAELPPAEPVLSDAMKKPAEWFKSAEGKSLADNIVSWQNPEGGWWKQYDPKMPRPASLAPAGPGGGPAPANDQEDAWRTSSTFDNGATYTEMRLLARAYGATKDDKYKQSFERGLNFVFDSQYPNGGWPQRFPLQNNYGRRITFNDKLMSSVMMLLKEISEGKNEFAFVAPDERKRAKEAFDRGVECVLKMQIKNPAGELTGWCQQHDETTLAPASARAYELPSIASFETADLVLVLMQIEKPDDRVKQAVTSAVTWLQRSAIHGKRYELIRDKGLKYGVDRRLSDDPNAPPLWARFYEIETNKPMFADRDGVKRYNLSEVGEERRAKYAWYGTWSEKVLSEYPKWAKRVGAAKE